MGQPVPLVCDHISGDSTDNKFENFRLVCCNCDLNYQHTKVKIEVEVVSMTETDINGRPTQLVMGPVLKTVER